MPGITSIRLRDKKEEVLSLWKARCLKQVPSAGSAVPKALRDSLPLYLDSLSEALATNLKMDFKSVFARESNATRIGKMHGSDRAGNRNYVLTEVIFEYHLLREVIFQVLEVDGSLADIQRDIVLDSIDQAVNSAAVEFSEIHTDIQQKFMNTLTHDLKSPITAAKLNAEMIQRMADQPPAGAKCAKSVLRSMNRLESMIHDLLDASRLRAGESLSLSFIQGDLNALIREVVEEVAVLHGSRFVLRSDGPLEGTFGLDGLRRALENLLGNAVKYGKPETPITVFLGRNANLVKLVVHNQGNPIPPEEIPLLFEDFRRAKSAQEGTKSGWGLGLTLVKGVIDAHAGQVRVESTVEKGTNFIIEIPFPKP